MDYRRCIQTTITYIEEHIKAGITVEDLAQLAGFSPYHYYRVFRGYVGLPVMEYVRRRRLAHCAAELASERRLVDIALDYGFESHEGFTRAFRRAYGVPPSLFRIHASGRLGPPVDLALMTELKLTGGMVMDPKLVMRPTFRVVGYELRVKHGDSRAIPEFWGRYLRGELGNKVCKALAVAPVSCAEYGICTRHDMETGEFTYVIGVEVDDVDGVPEGLSTVIMPEATYAVFTTPPSSRAEFTQSIQGTWRYIYETWLPESGYEFDGSAGADFEFYPHIPGEDTCVYAEIHIPVVKRAQE